jgi:hypothetical protein
VSGTGTSTEHTRQELMRALNARMKFEKVPSKHAKATASGTDAYAERTYESGG